MFDRFLQFAEIVWIAEAVQVEKTVEVAKAEQIGDSPARFAFLLVLPLVPPGRYTFLPESATGPSAHTRMP